jgi:hypothetical protein
MYYHSFCSVVSYFVPKSVTTITEFPHEEVVMFCETSYSYLLNALKQFMTNIRPFLIERITALNVWKVYSSNIMVSDKISKYGVSLFVPQLTNKQRIYTNTDIYWLCLMLTMFLFICAFSNLKTKKMKKRCILAK